MNGRVDLVLFGCPEPVCPWPLGRIHTTAATPSHVSHLLARQDTSSTAAWMLWDGALGAPDAEQIVHLLGTPGDVWHAGLKLGTAGLPGMIDFVAPTWMFNSDPYLNVEATSWRLSPKACLLRTSVVRCLGGPRPEFQALDAAALEMGHRFLRRGALARHVPSLVPAGAVAAAPTIPLVDELRFVYFRFGLRWTLWAVMRAIATGYARPREILRALRAVLRDERPVEPAPFRQPPDEPAIGGESPRVTVLIPTLNRYPYLRTLLEQLRAQTVKPHEVVIVDQTPVLERDPALARRFPELPIRLLYLDRPGQCSARNAGLRAATGDYILFLDDDEEIEPDLLKRHLVLLASLHADGSCGVVREIGAGALPSDFGLIRASDVFPANTLLRREALSLSGLFDLAYDLGPRADADFGMRLYQAGAILMLAPHISTLHHRASQGGLRAHRARLITYAGSRASLWQRDLSSITEIYFERRYFTTRQVREFLWQTAFGTFSARGNAIRKAAKLVTAAVCLPATVIQLASRYKQAGQLLCSFPHIPAATNQP